MSEKQNLLFEKSIASFKKLPAMIVHEPLEVNTY
jgi:hypothetical protein